MALVVDRIQQLLPPGSKTTPSGWLTMNAPCCHHRGHRPDDRRRGGMRFDSGVVYHCFNCGFSTGWQPGSPFGEKLRNLVLWMGGTDSDVRELVFEAMKTERSDYNADQDNFVPDFEIKELPEGSISLITALAESPEKAVPVAEYLMSRGFKVDDFDFMWSPEMDDRVILPFYHQHKLVGYTARRIVDRKPKYLSSQNPHTVFNLDRQSLDHKYLLVCEGPFDALSVGGVAVLSNEVSLHQARLINNYNSQVVVIPDQDLAGLTLIDQAIEHGWSVAFPTWEDGVKDCAEAVLRYGKLFVIVDAIMSAQQGEIKITVARNKLESKLKRLANEKNN